jgi:hypothetical protein
VGEPFTISVLLQSTHPDRTGCGSILVLRASEWRLANEAGVALDEPRLSPELVTLPRRLSRVHPRRPFHPVP